MHRERRTAPEAGHLGDGAAEIEIDVVDADLLDQPAHGIPGDAGIDGVELHAADRLVRGEGGHRERLRVPLDEGTCRDHLAHVEPGAVGAAEPSERDVRHARHGREDHRRVDLERPEREGAAHGRAGARPRCSRSRLLPEVGDGDPELAEEIAKERQGETDHVARVPLDAVDEGSRATVEGEGAGRGHRLAGREIGLDLLVGGFGEADLGGRHADCPPPEDPSITQCPVNRVPRPPAHRAQPAACLVDARRFPVHPAVELEERVAGDDRRRRRLEATRRPPFARRAHGRERGCRRHRLPFSLTPLTSTTGSNPASRSSRSRAVEPEASTRVRAAIPAA